MDLARATGLAALSPDLSATARETFDRAKERRTTDEIVMVARLYHPRLNERAYRLDASSTELVDAINGFLGCSESDAHADRLAESDAPELPESDARRMSPPPATEPLEAG
jgi:hypothetical protein